MHRRWFTWLGAALVGSCLAANSEAQVQVPRFAPDVATQFSALSERPEAMGFELHGPDPSACRHFQGVVRTESADGTPYLFVSRSGILPPILDCPYQIGGDGSPTSALYIVRMGSRDKSGERMRSNRLQRDRTTSETPPDQRDTVVRFIAYDGTEAEDYGHPGGMQLVGNVLALVLEQPRAPGLPITMVQFLDVTNPENPQITSRFEPKDKYGDAIEKAGVIGITPCAATRPEPPCAAGRYLMVITGGDNRVLQFYLSTTDDLSSPSLSWWPIETFEADHGLDCEPLGGCVPRLSPDEIYLGENWPDYHQTLQFLRESDLNGTLYLAGAIGHFMGDDFIYLYRVDFVDNEVKLKSYFRHHKISHPAHDQLAYSERLANFGAASTFHVTPSGELLFYATEHDNDGPTGSNDRGTVKMGEWRHRDMVRPGSPTLAPTVNAGGPYVANEGSSIELAAIAGPPATKAWVQLYEHPSYAGRDVVVDFDDRGKDDFDNFDHLDSPYLLPELDINDEASSLRWFAPVGCTIRANYDDDPVAPLAARRLTLLSAVGPLGYSDLEHVLNDAGTGETDDTFTSVQFLGDCEDYYSRQMDVVWDLDHDGTPETNSPTVDVLAEEGPALLQVPVYATHPVDLRTGVGSAVVTVLNVAPSIQSFAAFNPGGREIGSEVPFAIVGQRITARAAFSDAGRLDHQSASVDWGDGTVDSVFDQFTDAFGGQEGLLQHGRRYLTAGTYDVALTVTDDDLGTGGAELQLRVLSPTQAVAGIIDLLDALIASSTNVQARARLIQARKALAGNVTGFGNDGALHKLQEKQTAAAVARLQNALSDLGVAQANGVDVSVLIALIEDVIAALAAGY